MKANESASQHFLEHEIVVLERHLLHGLAPRASMAAQRFLHTLDVLLSNYTGSKNKQLYPFEPEVGRVELVADLARRMRITLETTDAEAQELIAGIIATRGCKLIVNAPEGFTRLTTPKGFVVIDH